MSVPYGGEDPANIPILSKLRRAGTTTVTCSACSSAENLVRVGASFYCRLCSLAQQRPHI